MFENIKIFMTYKAKCIYVQKININKKIFSNLNIQIEIFNESDLTNLISNPILVTRGFIRLALPKCVIITLNIPNISAEWFPIGKKKSFSNKTNVRDITAFCDIASPLKLIRIQNWISHCLQKRSSECFAHSTPFLLRNLNVKN